MILVTTGYFVAKFTHFLAYFLQAWKVREKREEKRLQVVHSEEPAVPLDKWQIKIKKEVDGAIYLDIW